MQKTAFYGWKLVGAFWLIYMVNLAFPTYGSSVINAYMATNLHMDRQMLGTAFSVYMLMVGLPGPLIALMVNKIGVKPTLVMGSLSVLVGSLAMSFLVHTGWQAVVAFGVVIGFGSCAGGAIAQQAGIAQWFVKRRSLALSLMYSSGGIGGFIAAPLLDRAISGAGGNWRVGWWMVAGFAGLSAILSAVFVKERPSDLGQLPDGGESAEAAPQQSHKLSVHRTTEEWTFGEALRTRTLWMLFASSVGISIGFTLFLAHGVVHLRDLGHTPAAAAFSISIMTICTLLGKLTASFGDRIDPRYLWAGAMTCFGIGMILVVHATSAADLYPYAVLLGFGWGTTLVCMMAVPLNYFGVKAYPAVVGLMLMVQTPIGAIAPVVAGHLYDQTKTYGPSFYTTAVLCFAGSLLLLVTTPPKRKVVEEQALPGSAAVQA
jgi:MFS family permease